MAVRSKRLFGPSSVGTGHVTLYTTPDGETALLKSLRLVNASALANVVTLKLNGTGGADSIDAITVPAQGAVRLDGMFLAFNPNDVLRAVATQASVFISGYGAELEGAAD